MPTGHRKLFTGNDPYAQFEQTVERLFGDRLRASFEDACAFWGALANVTWHRVDHPDDDVGYSFRAGGDLLAAIRKDKGDMTYMNYYCRAPYAAVPVWVASAMKEAGWKFSFDCGDI